MYFPLFRLGLILTLSALVAFPAAAAGTLARRAPLAVYPAMNPAPGRGVPIDRVEAGGTAAALGLKAGDRILAVNGVTVSAAAALAAETRKLSEGDEVRLSVLRGDGMLQVAGRAIGRPKESWPGAVVDYGAVEYAGGLLRDIYVAPGAGHVGPVVFLIPGYTCTSIEVANPEEPYRRLIGDLLARGIAVYRIEKPGMGDSRGTPDCQTTDFDVELAAFQTGYRSLTGARGVHPDRVFLFGHSMGGLEAPLIAAKAPAPPRGIAVFGTVVRNWHDYYMDIAKAQDFLLTGADPVETARDAEAIRATVGEVYLGQRTLAELGADPKHAPNLRRMQWDGGSDIAGRSFDFWRDLASLDLTAAWRDARSEVLSLYGQSDIVALNDEDHRLIAEIVNHYRPGTAVFVEVANTDHGMTLAGDRLALRRSLRRGGQQAAPAPYNPQVSSILADWIEAAMKKPPVRKIPARATGA